MLPRRVFSLTALTAAALVAGCAATASPPAEPAVAKQETAEEDKVVCVREAPTGSRMLQTRCYTLRSLEQRARDDRNAAENIQTRPHDRAAGGG
jgi:TolA-binding protein